MSLNPLKTIARPRKSRWWFRLWQGVSPADALVLYAGLAAILIVQQNQQPYSLENVGWLISRALVAVLLSWLAGRKGWAARVLFIGALLPFLGFDIFYTLRAYWTAPWFYRLSLPGGVLLVAVAWIPQPVSRAVFYWLLTAGLASLPYWHGHLAQDSLWYFLPVYLAAALAGLAILWASERRPHGLSLLLLALSLGIMPLEDQRYLPLNTADKLAIASQTDVQRLFAPDAPPPVPASRMEFLCDPATGARLVTPHTPSRTVAFFRADGGVGELDLGTEASQKSMMLNGALLTQVKSELLRIDIARGQVAQRWRVFPSDRVGFYLQADPGGRFVGMTQEMTSHCAVVDLIGNEPPQRLPMRRVEGECIPLSSSRAVISDNDWFRRRLRLMEIPGGKVLREIRYPDWGFFEIVADFRQGLLYAPSSGRGRIDVFALPTLEKRGSLPTINGVRSVLVDPRRPDRLFSFSYFTGEVAEQLLPSGEIRRRWVLGPTLRGLAWDCDGRSLLGATNQGGFRIQPGD